MAQDLFSVDLAEQAKQHILFLRNLHKHGVTINDRPRDEESFRRYSQLWLPFVRKYGHKKNASEEESSLIPPADIAWLWHCHRLAPYRYAQYVQREFVQQNDAAAVDSKDSSSFKVLDASHPFVFQLENNDSNETFSTQDHADISQHTMELFLQMYPDESFFLKDANSSSTGVATKLAGFDVIESCARQATFLWQVSGPNFRNDEFLKQGIANYAKFVQLMGQKSKPQFLVPTYQIDLMWHTHMLASIAKYHKDNMQINGCTLEHDDSLNDRTEGGKLDTNFQETRKLWSRVYGVEYKVPGGMYRGEPPVEYFNADWTEKHLGMVGSKPHPMTFAHLIGQVGASSHGKAVWMSVDSPEAFLPPNAKSATRGVNANPIKDGYVFGSGGAYLLHHCSNAICPICYVHASDIHGIFFAFVDKGIGFYNLNTREAYDVVIKRIELLITKINSDKCGCYVLGIFPLPLVGFVCAIPAISKLNIKKEELEDAKKVAEARRNAAGPSADLSLPAALQERLKKRSPNSSGNTGTDGGYVYYDNSAYYTGAAACGVMIGGGGGDGDG